ncbi:MAG: TIGR00159 family protein [Ruminococcaceae bacterium]|nr:TIGR00159 family protein [Oscillospiraceae bacterium]
MMTWIWNFIGTIRVTDIIDIAIIAYIIYRLITFVRRTNSANVIKGIALLVAIMWISQLLHLNVISYLLGNTFELGILALVVLFQPELRRFLEQVGSSNFKLLGRTENQKAIETAITQTVLACQDMSRSKTGALLVFERDMKLDTYINTGAIINAQPSVELLKNIFYPKTPLHDGAVIIREGRIAGAACMLPLSTNNNLSRELGMRHRAGIGISERSDAVVVVVSEETGSISVAVEGILKRHLNSETFETLLRKELMPVEEEKQSWSMKIRSQVIKNEKNDRKEKNKKEV